MSCIYISLDFKTIHFYNFPINCFHFIIFVFEKPFQVLPSLKIHTKCISHSQNRAPTDRGNQDSVFPSPTSQKKKSALFPAHKTSYREFFPLVVVVNGLARLFKLPGKSRIQDLLVLSPATLVRGKEDWKFISDSRQPAYQCHSLLRFGK